MPIRLQGTKCAKRPSGVGRDGGMAILYLLSLSIPLLLLFLLAYGIISHRPHAFDGW